MSKGMIEKSHEIARLYSVPVGRVTFKGWRPNRREGFYVDMPTGEVIFAGTKDGPILPPLSGMTIVATLQLSNDGRIGVSWSAELGIGGFLILDGATLIDQILIALRRDGATDDLINSLAGAQISLRVPQ